MGKKFLKIFIVQGLILKVLSSFVQPAIKQYLITGVNQSPGLNNVPANLPYQQPAPSTGLSSLSSLSLPNLVSLLAQTGGNTAVPTLANQNFARPPNVPNTNLSPVSLPSASPSKSEGIDSSVLNNLAIAVQLLVLNNILNAPVEESKPFEAFETVPVGKPPSHGAGYCKIPAASPPSSSSSYTMPNANFVGSSGFTESPMLGSSTIFPYGSPPPMSKSSLSLMSPYEALGPNSPFSDPILSSPYGSAITSKNNFVSPYSVIDNDLFSMTDFY